jgi:hypothetical protein
MDELTNEIATRETWENIPIDTSKKIFVELNFSQEQYTKMKRGLIPHEMEDKWFIFFENNWLYFHRSWTGYGIYKAEIKENNGRYCINEFFVERNKEKYKCENDNEDIDSFTFLIAWGLLNVDVREIFFKKNINNENETIKSWSNFGGLFISKKDIEIYNAQNNEIDNVYDTFYVAGFSYHEGNNIIDKLQVGCELKLVTESENKYDKYAVAIYYGEYKLGYIPMKRNKKISKLLNYGHSDIFEVKINKINDEENLEERINVEILIKDNKRVDFA